MRTHRGFTLVELMIGVAITGILASLGIFGVSRYMAISKTAEAKDNLGAITRQAVAAYEKGIVLSELLAGAGESSAVVHQFCNSSTTVPAALAAVKSIKYQPSTASGADFNTGNSDTGWECLGFSMSQPINYQLRYTRGVGTIVTNPANSPATGFEALARGDLDGDTIPSVFARTALVRDGKPILATYIHIENEFE